MPASSPSSTADVVVVGGGILGCCAALHLAESGVGKIVQLERDGIGQATSGAGAGFIGEWAAGFLSSLGPHELAVERYGLGFYARLADEDPSFGYQQNGSLWAATSQPAWDAHIKPIVTSEFPTERTVLDAGGVAAASGVIRATATAGGVLHPKGAQVEAHEATQAVAKLARRSGVEVRDRLPVTGIMRSGERVTGVLTREGVVSAGAVVLAAGPWTNVILRPAGAWLPVVPLAVSRVVTEPLGIPAGIPTLMLPEFGFWLRESRAALLWGCTYEQPPRYRFAEVDVPERTEEFPMDGVLAELRVGGQVSQVVPALGRYRSFSVAHGCPGYTPDGRALAGPLPGVEGLYVIAGCNEAGITHGPGYGRFIAEYVRDGKPAWLPADAFAPGRFGTRYHSGADVTAAVRTRYGFTEEQQINGL
jgi:glycine/D-amino acid oxidase-like deaminating enzyme